MPQKSDRFAEHVAKVVAALENAAEITGPVVVEYGKALIGKPVERLDSGAVIRSLPGEPPRKDMGDLQAGLQHDVERVNDREVRLEISTSHAENPNVPSIMEFGGEGVEQRPYFVADGGDGSMFQHTKDVAGKIAGDELKKIRL